MTRLCFAAASLCLCLIACDTPTIGFLPDRSVAMVEDGMRFRVHLKGDRAQAVRLSNVGIARQRQARAAALRVIETVSGCRVARIEGGSDSVLTKAQLSC
ncbi:MAG: hypothetical protein AAF631_11070 [Pseudomonadota bacterium]